MQEGEAKNKAPLSKGGEVAKVTALTRRKVKAVNVKDVVIKYKPVGRDRGTHPTVCDAPDTII